MSEESNASVRRRGAEERVDFILSLEAYFFPATVLCNAERLLQLGRLAVSCLALLRRICARSSVEQDVIEDGQSLVTGQQVRD